VGGNLKFVEPCIEGVVWLKDTLWFVVGPEPVPRDLPLNAHAAPRAQVRAAPETRHIR